MNNNMTNSLANERANPSVIVMGVGMTGIQLAIKLREAGITDITMLEKASSMGGTWRENTYPGIACDVPSHAYTYSFEPNPDWSSFFPSGSEIYQYFKKVFYKYGLDAITNFDEAVTSCTFDDTTSKWTVKTSKNKTYVADLLFSSTGILHKPVLPEIEGRESFEGPAFHTARWDHEVNMDGKRIGVIGTGSTASQVIPKLIDMPNTDVTVFQRTPQWIVKTTDKQFTDFEKDRFKRQPFRMNIVRWLTFFIYAQGTAVLTSDTRMAKIFHRLSAYNAERNLKKSIRDPALRKKLTPEYKFGCKRVVMNDSFYEGIQKPNAHLEIEGIDHIEADGIVTKDGKKHELDVIVYATGFDPAAFMRPMEFKGKGGISIDEAWKKKIRAHRSISIPEFPNFFLMLGPNSPIGNNSVIEMSEIQTEYAIKIIKEWQAGKLDTIEATSEATESWGAMIKERMSHTVWTSGCQSWYLDADGDALAWPDSWKNWKKLMATPQMSDFVQPGPTAGKRKKPSKADIKAA